MSELMSALQKLAEHCLATQNMVVTAESCTGGGIGYHLTQLPGSSAWFDRGFITYSNASKIDCLDVPMDILEAHGAVSQTVAISMANGALKHSNATLSVAVTGVAGPNGGSVDKPVGTVWIAWGAKEREAQAKCFLFKGNREAIRHQTIQSAVEGLIRLMP
ncbi:MAG: damage-inducible protein CinA [Legionellales bacterium]|nr:damage-inducible protein CinA [Legionellales bacterium]